MKAIRSFTRALITAVVITLLFRPMIGLYTVFGAVTLLIPAAAGMIVSLILVNRRAHGFFFVTLIHIALVTGFEFLFDKFRLLGSVADDFALALCDITGTAAVPVNMIRCMLVLLPVYFGILILSAAILSYTANKRRERKRTEYREYEEGFTD